MAYARSAALWIAAAAWCWQAAAVETVRVDASSGAPRLVVDGKPARARMFWGAPASGRLAIGPAGQEVAFDFSPVEDEPARATMHLRFGNAPGDVYLDEIHVVDLTTGQDVVPRCDFEGGEESFRRQWTLWPTGERNTVGKVSVEPGAGREGSSGLHIKLTSPPDGRWPDFHVYHHPTLALRKADRLRVRLWVRAEPARPLTVAFYRPGDDYVFLGGPTSPLESQIRLAAEAGVNFVSFPVPLPWPRPGQPVDWSAVDTLCQRVIDANPAALVLPRIGMDPPPWWRQSHPDEVMAWDQGPQEHVGAVVASPVYRRDAAERLAALIRHVEEKFGPHVAGYHPCGQNTGEWFYQDTWKTPLNGYAPADQRAWRQWLTRRYGDDVRLRAAWNNPDVALASAVVPSPAERRAAPAGVLIDPVAQRPLVDFAEYQQEMMADCVCHLAHAAREATAGRKLVVFFYGYVFEFAAIRNGPATSGHYALRRVLQSPDIDVLCSPISYFDRGLGQSAPAMTAAESVALAGKMWLYEDDTSTFLSTGVPPGSRDRVRTIHQTNALLTRNTGQCALRNFGTWWMDLGSTGWFNDRRMWAQMARLKALDDPLLEHPLPFRPEVAAVIDPRSMLRVAAGGHVMARPGVYEARQPLGRMGAPYGQYLLDDVLAGRVKARMYVLLTPWCLSPQEREQLLAATRGSLRVWCYAPGYHDGYSTSLDAMCQLTGFRMKEVSPANAVAQPTALGKRLGVQASWGVATRIAPLFAAADATPEETLAAYADGSAAVALRHVDDGWSLFAGSPGLTSELLRLAARRAGAHLFTETDCNVYANGPYVVLHAAEDGPLEINTGRPEPVADLLDGRPVGRGPRFVLPIRKGETRVLGSTVKDSPR